MSSVILTRGATSITINTPQYGYTSELHLALSIGDRLGNGKRESVDKLQANDYRLFKPNFVLNSTQQKELQDFFRENSEARGQHFQLFASSKIFPFCPDFGDNKRFICGLLSSKFAGAVQVPWINFNSDFSIIRVSSSSHSLPAKVHQGNRLRVGSVEGFRYPPSFYDAESSYAINTAGLPGGDARSIDRTDTADWYECSMQVAANESLTAHLIHEFQNTIRGNDFDIECDANSFPFGRDKCAENRPNAPDIEGSGVFTVRLIDNIIRVTHEGFNQFITTFKIALIKWYRIDSSSSVSVSSYSDASESSSSGSIPSLSSSSESSSSGSQSLSLGSPSSWSLVSMSSSSGSSISFSSSSKSSSSKVK